MMIEVMKSKLHCVTVTEANLNYMGSITIDEDLMDAANLIAGEKVQVLDNNNGERFETYIIKGERQRADGHKGTRMRKLRGKYDFIAVRADEAHELLKRFEQPVGFARLLGLRMSIFFRNLF